MGNQSTNKIDKFGKCKVYMRILGNHTYLMVYIIPEIALMRKSKQKYFGGDGF